MCNGQKLSGIIIQILTTMMELDIEQKAKLEKIMKSNLGAYSPEDMAEDMQDINEMMLDGDVDGLLARLKIYPQVDSSDKATPYLNGTECTMREYLSADNLAGKRELRFNNPDRTKQARKPYLNMSLEEFSDTAYGDTLFTGSAGNGIFGEGKLAGSNYRKVNTPNQVAFELITKEVIERELLRNYSRGKYKDLKEVFKSKHMDKLMAYLTSVLVPELIDIYLLIIWCKNGIRKAHKHSSPSSVKPTVKIKPNELTTVELTDEQFDKVENNVKLIGVGKSGELLHPRDKKKYKN